MPPASRRPEADSMTSKKLFSPRSAPILGVVLAVAVGVNYSPQGAGTPLRNAAAVTAVAGGAILNQDTFATRSVAGGWGNASDGNAWKIIQGTVGAFSVGNN